MIKANAADYFTPPQIAAMLGVDHGKIIKWIRNGELHAVDLSLSRRQRPRYKIARTDLETFLKRRSTKPTILPARATKCHDMNAHDYY